MALTKVTGQVIKNTTDVTVGVLTVTNTLAVGGTVSIGGTLTYEDVTNVDAVGLITARNGIVVGSGITLSKDGDVFFTGIATGNGSGLTALNASNLGSGTVPTARLGSGTASSSTFLRGDSTFQTVNTDLVSDTSPQLGGDLDLNGNKISVGDGGRDANQEHIRFGDDGDLRIYHTAGGDSTIEHSSSGTDLKIITTATGDDIILESEDDIVLRDNDGSTNFAKFINGAAVELYHNGSKKFETASYGVTVTGTLSLPDGDSGVNAEGGIKLGNSGDFHIYHDGSNSYLKENGTGDLVIVGKNNIKFLDYGTNQTMCNMASEGAVELYYANSKKLETYNSGVKVYSGHLRIVGDEGGESKLDLYADEGDDAYDAWQVKAGGSSDFYISGYNGSAFETAIKATGNGAVELYHDNSIRLQTTTNGVTAGGTIDTSQTAVVGAQAGFFGGAKSSYASATGLIQNQVCILDTATSAAAGTGGALTFAGYIDNDSTTYYATIEGVKENSSTNNYAGSLKFLTRSHNVANMNLAMVIDSSGDVIIGGTAVEAQAAITLEPNRDDGAGRITFNRANTSNVSVVIEMQNNNSQVGRIEHDHTGAALISGSDYRLKENDVAISDGITRVKQLRPIRFNWKSEPSQTVDGFFAHEISSIVPEAVSGEKDAVDSEGNIIMQGISKEKLVPLLTAALQEAIAKIETLETKVAALEG